MVGHFIWVKMLKQKKENLCYSAKALANVDQKTTKMFVRVFILSRVAVTS